MTDDPKHKGEKPPTPGEKHNAQGDHEGVAHSPEEFDAMNPQKQVPTAGMPEVQPKSRPGIRKKKH